MVILAHPNSKSFNHAIAKTVVDTLKQNGYRVYFHDLYKEKFGPILRTKEILAAYNHIEPLTEKHCSQIAYASGIIIVHPNWWGQPPAILKGWIDRVIRPGIAYQFAEGDKGEGIPIGLLMADKALVFNTSDTLPKRELTVFGDPLETLWKKCIFNYCGVKKFYRKTYSVIVTSSSAQRKAWLTDVKKTINQCFHQTNLCLK